MEDSTEKKLLNLSQRVLSCVHAGSLRRLLSLCTPDALLKYGPRCGHLRNSGEALGLLSMGPARVSWVRAPYIGNLGVGGALVAGAYLVRPEGPPAAPPLRLECTLLFFGGKAAYIELARPTPPGRRHIVSAVNRDVYCLYECDILYVEVFQDHLHWHLPGELVESLGTLSGVAQRLSEDFVKVHRSYIVNKNHVMSVRRCGGKQCALTMDNGDVIPIPYDKFVACRDELACPAGGMPLSAALGPGRAEDPCHAPRFPP